MEVTVNAHMPGLVARVLVSEGNQVKKGQDVAVINCMKTELHVSSHYNGVVKKVLVKEWDEVEVDTPMIILDADEG